jgi:hypothetical protein
MDRLSDDNRELRLRVDQQEDPLWTAAQIDADRLAKVPGYRPSTDSGQDSQDVGSGDGNPSELPKL